MAAIAKYKARHLPATLHMQSLCITKKKQSDYKYLINMTENEEFIFESIYEQVRKGFLSIAEIRENIKEEIEGNEFNEEISIEWANKIIEEEYNQLIQESKSWERPTDTSRLIQVFNRLCEENIIALHNAGYTSSDGHYECVEVERELRKVGKISDGYCFYHEQDLNSAIVPENPSLMIAFQKVNNSDDEVTIGIGRKIVEVIKEYNFEVDWNETATRKIEIVNFSWKKLYDHSDIDLLDYERVVDLMVK